jgi:hypothetical protein
MSKHVFPIFIWFIDHQFLLSNDLFKIYWNSCEIHMGGKYIQYYAYLMGRKRNDTNFPYNFYCCIYDDGTQTRVRYKWLHITLNLFHEWKANGRFEARKKSVRKMKSIFWNEWREKWFIWKIYTKSYENLNRKVFFYLAATWN